VPGAGPADAHHAGRRATGRSGRPDRRAVRRRGGPHARPCARRGRDRSRPRVRDQRGQALQVGAARQARLHKTPAQRGRRVPLLARARTRDARAARDRRARRDGAARGAAGQRRDARTRAPAVALAGRPPRRRDVSPVLRAAHARRRFARARVPTLVDALRTADSRATPARRTARGDAE
jgi:hypothetical protein